MLNLDFREFVQSLNAKGVRYLVIGGYAMAAHGHPRYTKDIDVWVEISPGNAERMVEALRLFGFESLGLIAADFLVRDQIIQLGYPPCRIDIITTPPGVDFAECYESRIIVRYGDVDVSFIDLEHLRQSKLASGRMQDLADLESLEAGAANDG